MSRCSSSSKPCIRGAFLNRPTTGLPVLCAIVISVMTSATATTLWLMVSCATQRTTNRVQSARFSSIWLSADQHWQIRCGSALTKIVRLIGGKHEVLFGFESGGPPFQFMLLLVATRTLYILGFRKMDSKNSVLHGCTERGGVDI